MTIGCTTPHRGVPGRFLLGLVAVVLYAVRGVGDGFPLTKRTTRRPVCSSNTHHLDDGTKVGAVAGNRRGWSDLVAVYELKRGFGFLRGVTVRSPVGQVAAMH